MTKLAKIIFGFLLFSLANVAMAGIIFEPYYSVKSTKNVDPNRKQGTQTEKTSLREEKGIKVGLGLGNLFKIQASVGQNFQKTTKTDGPIEDEYDEIDLNKDIDTSGANATYMKKETQNLGKASLIFDPGFWIFIMRLKAGITAKQRIISMYQNDVMVSEEKPAPTYKPHAGLGLGVKLTPRMYFVIEYNAEFYAFPKAEPFEKELAITYGFSI